MSRLTETQSRGTGTDGSGKNHHLGAEHESGAEADLQREAAGELGVLSTHVARHVEALPHISRCHVYRIGDGGAHLHVWFFARPLGQAQLFGSWLPVWDDLLPEYPTHVATADAGTVAGQLVTSYGGWSG